MLSFPWCGLGEFACPGLELCEAPEKANDTGAKPRGGLRQNEPECRYPVELVASPIAGLHGVVGYHTSVLVAGNEFFFSPGGLTAAPGVVSHVEDERPIRMPLGTSHRSGAELLAALDRFFAPGSYDLLRKNCNSFTDVALHFLCGERLAWTYQLVERLGRLGDERLGLMQTITSGEYLPNPAAEEFDVDAIIALLDLEGRDISESTEAGTSDSDSEASDDYADEAVFFAE